MNEENMNRVLELLNTWWREEDIEEEDLKARVVFIFIQGDSIKFGNTDQLPYLTHSTRYLQQSYKGESLGL